MPNDAELSRLLKMIRFNSEEEVKQEADRYISRLFQAAKSLQQHHIAVMELVSVMYRFASNHDITVSAFSGDMRELYGKLLEMEPDSLRKWFTELCLSFREYLISTRNKSTKTFVQKAQEYVRSHYMEAELSLDSMCEELGVSNSYFSTIFKKETGNSFISYLTDYRMDQAARRLLETNEKSYMIAKEVGYTDPNYFSYVFKRRFGVSPSKYRTEHAASES